MLVTRQEDGEFSRTVLFETSLTPLVGANVDTGCSFVF
jgi:hypothetical protein